MCESICLEWKNLEFTIKNKIGYNYRKLSNIEETVKILKCANGYATSGSIIAILGSSGAGKTTLLGSISQRLKGNVSGEILINNAKISQKDMINVSCFIPQFDVSYQQLTTREHLYFISELKMNKNISKVRKKLKIDELLCEFGLLKIGDSQILSLSGGERKRLSIVTELLTDPPIIFCDEPTTGLDSYNALSVIKTLKCFTTTTNCKNNEVNISTENIDLFDTIEMNELLEKNNNYPKIVLCSIHQPTSDVFQCFTHVILMNLGEIVFQGTTNDAAIYFSRLGFKCPSNYNPADFYVKLITEKNCEIALEENQITNADRVNWDAHYYQAIDFKSFNNNNQKILWISQMLLLIKRSALITKRTLADELIILTVYLLTTITISLYFGNITEGTQSSIQNVQGAFFSIITELIFSSSYEIHDIMPSNLPILRRETGENYYSLSAYYLGIILMRIPNSLIRAFLSFGIFYLILNIFKINLLYYLKLAGTMTLISIAGNSYGFMISGMFESSNITSEIATPFDLMFILLSGIYINLRSVPFLKYISIFFYGTEAVSLLYWTDITYLECPENYNGSCLTNGIEVLQEYAYEYDLNEIWIDYLGLIILSIIMNCIGFIGVRKCIQRIGYY